MPESIAAMSLWIAIPILIIAAALEAYGDHSMGGCLKSAGLAQRLHHFALGAVVLATYGVVVNLPRWKFGDMLGFYIMFFFVMTQWLSWRDTHEKPISGSALEVG